MVDVEARREERRAEEMSAQVGIKIKGRTAKDWLLWCKAELADWERWHGTAEYSKQTKYLVEAFMELLEQVQERGEAK
jgi:hypothetical protein